MPHDQAFIDALQLVTIDRSVDISQFNCNEELNWFLKNRAVGHHAKRIATVLYWVSGKRLAGYMSTAMTRMEIEDPKLRSDLDLDGVTHTEGGSYERRFPALLIAMLGVCQSFRGKGLGPWMVQHAIGQARDLSNITGCRFVSVDSMNTPEALKMYSDAKFKRPEVKKPRKGNTVWMYYDLLPRPVP